MADAEAVSAICYFRGRFKANNISLKYIIVARLVYPYQVVVKTLSIIVNSTVHMQAITIINHKNLRGFCIRFPSIPKIKHIKL